MALAIDLNAAGATAALVMLDNSLGSAPEVAMPPAPPVGASCRALLAALTDGPAATSEETGATAADQPGRTVAQQHAFDAAHGAGHDAAGRAPSCH